MKNLKNIIVSSTALVLVSSCVLLTSPRFDEIPKGPHCLILKRNAFCIDDSNGKESTRSFKQVRGWEAVPMGYKQELESFLYDIIEENETLRIQCGDEE